MRIGIDARFVGPQGTGLGKYTEKLIGNLQKIDSLNQYVIFLTKQNWHFLKLNKNFTGTLADVPWYSVAEQLKLPKIFEKANLDLLHVPHFNVPTFYRGKFVVTIHDLIHHHFKEQSSSTRNPLVFKIKRIAYRKVVDFAIGKSQKILVPSNFIKKQILQYFYVDPQKIFVTYEAAEEEYFARKPDSPITRQPNLIYVGNAYPHKNLNALLDALKLVIRPLAPQVIRGKIPDNQTTRIPDNLGLILVCPRDVFSESLKKEIESRGLKDKVELKGYLTPGSLAKLFQKAQAYVFPSLSEGFGIPGLNAMAAGLPVICSNIPTLKEVYGDAALYFDPKDPADIAKKIQEVISNPETRINLVEKGRVQVEKYSWSKMAQETLKVYEDSLQESTLLNTLVKKGTLN